MSTGFLLVLNLLNTSSVPSMLIDRLKIYARNDKAISPLTDRVIYLCKITAINYKL